MTDFSEVAGLLHRGGIIAYPTEGVWGLGCDPCNEQAVLKILALKRRPLEKGLVLVAGNIAQLESLIKNLEPACREILESSWPGPHTWLIPDVDQIIPDWIKGQFDTVAVRVSGHPLVAGLCNSFGGPIVSTSANPADLPPAMTRTEVETYFPRGIDLVVPGELGGQKGPSTIKDLMSQQVIR